MRQPEPRPDIARCQRASRAHCGKERLTRFRSFLPAEPVLPDVGRSVVAFIAWLRSELSRIARELDVFGPMLGILRREQRPRSPLAERLEPIAAQAICQRKIGVAIEKASHRRGIGLVELELELPVRDVGLEKMAFETRRDTLEPGRIAGPVCIARRDEIGVSRLRARRRSNAGGKGKRERRAMARGGNAKS